MTERYSDVLQRYRVFARLFSVLFGVMVWEANEHFWALPEPNQPQSVAYSAIMLAAAGWFKFYVDGRRSDDKQ